MDLSKLKELPVEKLRELAMQHGLAPHHKCKPETIANMIIEHVTTPAKAPEMKHPAEKPNPALKINTEEEVREACKPFINKEGFEAIFTPETWYFRCNGAEDSGHMSTALRVIRMKAETISRGARRPVKIIFDGEPIMAA